MTTGVSTRARPAKRSQAWSVLAGQAAFIALGVYVLAASVQLGLWTSLGPGPGLFPFAMGALLVLMSLIWLVQERRAPTVPAEGPDRTQVVAVVVSLLVLAAALNFIGFQVGLFLFLMYHLKIRARLRWFTSLVISVAGSVGVFYLFTLGLKVSLPMASIPPLSLIGL
jgi:putative tricarboxylic transport membrane protein